MRSDVTTPSDTAVVTVANEILAFSQRVADVLPDHPTVATLALMGALIGAVQAQEEAGFPVPRALVARVPELELIYIVGVRTLAEQRAKESQT